MADCIISAENIAKKYAEKTLFETTTIGIHAGDKIGLMGINGSGKSTLLKILCGEEYSDSGNIVMQNGLSLNYLPQLPRLDKNLTILEQIYKCRHPHFLLLKEYKKLSEKLDELTDHQTEEYKSTAKEHSRLLHKIESENAWDIEVKAKSVLTILGFTDLNLPIANLSGGQQRRVDLARVLLDKPDILLLDEPTNHLDTDTVEWLQEYLVNFKGTLVFVTHDRYFLDAVSNKILEIDRQKMQFYPGNYSDYLKRKEMEDIDLQRKETRRQAQLKKEIKWLQRGAKARTSKPKDHVDRVKELIDKSYLTTEQELDISFQSQRLGKTILEIHNLSVGYEDNVLLKDFSYNFQKMDRIGIIGPNGCGKSTLIKAITEEIIPQTGKIKQGHNTKIACLSQAEPSLNPNISVNDYIKSFAENIRTKDGVLHSADQILEKFLFDKKMQMSKISSLSGGEKKRLFLLASLIFGSNFLILDEPTNDLDIRTLEILEDFLDAYQGCIILVSHDRFILDRIADFLFIFQEDKTIRKFPGNYSDYLLVKKFNEENIAKESVNTKNNHKEKKIKKLSYKEEQLLIKSEQEIEKLETEQIEINKIISTKAHELAHSEFVALSKRLEEIDEKLIELYNTWEELSTKQIEIENSV